MKNYLYMLVVCVVAMGCSQSMKSAASPADESKKESASLELNSPEYANTVDERMLKENRRLKAELAKARAQRDNAMAVPDRQSQGPEPLYGLPSGPGEAPRVMMRGPVTAQLLVPVYQQPIPGYVVRFENSSSSRYLSVQDTVGLATCAGEAPPGHPLSPWAVIAVDGNDTAVIRPNNTACFVYIGCPSRGACRHQFRVVTHAMSGPSRDEGIVACEPAVDFPILRDREAVAKRFRC